uniref:Odorant receptor n=1 Tax=Timema poppense TaxID=170557 RepID=A0A7R9DCE4_TIMPO|nr:unnamed protein product [Timema poppensis]
MKFFPMVITALKIMGVYDIFENSVVRRVYVAFLFICLSINSFAWCVTILLHLTDIQRFTQASFYFVTGINTVVKLYRILSKRRDLNRLIKSFDDIFLKIEAHINIPEHLSIKSLDNRVQKCLLVSWLGAALLCCTYSLSPVTDVITSGSFTNIPLKYNSEHNIIEEGLPLKCWWPFDVTTYPTYQLTYAYQVTFLFIHIMYYIVINTILYAVLYHIIHRFKILRYALKNVIEASIKKVINKEMEGLSSELKQRDYKLYNPRKTNPLIMMMKKTYSSRTGECIQIRSRNNRRSLSERARRVGSLKTFLSRLQNSHRDDLIGLYESCDCDWLHHNISIQMEQDLKLCIQYSQCLLSVCSQLEEIIHPIVCADMLSTLLVFCVCTFQLSLELYKLLRGRLLCFTVRLLRIFSAFAPTTPTTLSTAWAVPHFMFSEPSVTNSSLYSVPMKNNPGILPDVLDFVVSRGIRRRLVLKSLAELDSDHSPVLVNLGRAVSFIDPPEKPNLKRTDWDRFANVLRERLGPTPTFRTAAEIDHGAELITSAIKGSLEASTPRHRPKRAPQASLPDSILRHVREKNRLRKAWQVSRDPVDKANWSRKVHAVREMVREYRNSVWEDKIESLCVQDRSLWQMTRNLMRVPAPRPPIVGRNGPDGQEFMSYLEVICDVGAMTLTLCWLSHELTIQSGLLVGSVFECNWLNAPHSFKTSLLTIMIRAQKPVTLSMGKCGPVNLGTFVSILKVAYSNFAILHDLNNR